MRWADDRDAREESDSDSDSEFDSDADDPTAPCPHCGAEIFDDAEWCPRCGRYLSREELGARRPAWFVVGVVLCLVVILGWVLR